MPLNFLAIDLPIIPTALGKAHPVFALQQLAANRTIRPFAGKAFEKTWPSPEPVVSYDGWALDAVWMKLRIEYNSISLHFHGSKPDRSLEFTISSRFGLRVHCHPDACYRIHFGKTSPDWIELALLEWSEPVKTYPKRVARLRRQAKKVGLRVKDFGGHVLLYEGEWTGQHPVNDFMNLDRAEDYIKSKLP